MLPHEEIVEMLSLQGHQFRHLEMADTVSQVVFICPKDKT